MGKGTWPNAWASGLAADLPAAADVGAGAYYLATDSGVLSQSDGVSAWTTIYTMPSSSSGVAEDLTTAETDDTLVLAPDGAGGVEFRAEAGGSALTVKDEGSNLDTAVTSIDFVGAGVVATNASHAVTVTISGATTSAIPYAIDGGGAVIATGSKGFVEVPFACTITAVRLLADVSGSITLTIKKASYSGFPTLSSIVASAKPTLSSAQKSQDTTLTGWTTAITAGDILEFNVDTVSTVTRVLVSLTVTRT